VPLSLVTGRANAGKTGIIYGALRRALEDGRAPVLLLPTHPDVVRARAELTGKGFVGLRIEQFGRHLETLWDVFGDGRRMASDVERDFLLRQALAEAPAVRLGEYGNSRGVRRVLTRLIERAAEEGAETTGAPDGPGADVIRVVHSYRSLVAARGLIEREDAFRLLADSEAERMGEPLMVHRFSDLTRSQERFVLAAADAGVDVWVSLPWEAGLPAAASVEPLASRLRRVATVIQVSEGSYTAVSELARLEAGLFSQPDPVDAEGAVDLVVAQGRDAEAAAIARTVAEHIAAGVRPEEIAVAFRDAPRHVRAVRRALEAAGVPADYDVRVTAAESPFGRAILHLWAFVAEGMSRIHLSAFLRTPFSGADPEVVDAMDARWRASRADMGEALLSALRECPVASARVRLARSLVVGRLDATAVDRWRELADGMLASAYPGDAPLLHSAAAVDARVHGMLQSIVASLAELEGEVGSGDVIESLREALVSPGAVERPGRVQVMGVERLRSRRFEAVVLGGLTASEFPQGEGEDGSSSEALGGAVRALGLPAVAQQGAARERLLYYEAVTRARRRLTLVRQESDDEGTEIAVSVFWDETLDLYRDPLAGSAPSGLPLQRRVTASDLGDLLPVPERAARIVSQGTIADPGLRGDLARPVVSVSDIEAYLACPYRWFRSRVVAPKALDLEIDARTRGTLAHDTLAEFYRRLPVELGVERVTADVVRDAVGLAERVTGEVIAGAGRPRSLDEQMALSTIGPLVARLVERDATFLPAWRPAEFEWSFGMDDAPHDFGTFLLRGRVDRVDDGPAGVVVIDYKTGSSSVTPQAKMLSEGKVQMPLYAAVASAKLGRPVAGGLYRSLSKRLDRGFLLGEAACGAFTRTDVVAAEDIRALIDGAVELAATAVEGMRAGRIEPLPSPDACRTCIAAGSCRAAVR
jgi:ATP-dependent helicase/nuclease subunit B